LLGIPKLELHRYERLLSRQIAARRRFWLLKPQPGELFLTDQRLIWLSGTPSMVPVESRIEIARDDITSVRAPSLFGERGRWWNPFETVEVHTTGGRKYKFELDWRKGGARVLDQWAKQV
jgi:hypothetical protein